jgi:hypothetical protein
MHNYFCEFHNHQIKFVCFNSLWHCEFLCEECIPLHNNLHLQNKTSLILKSFENIYNESTEKLEKFSQFLEKKKKILEEDQNDINNYDLQKNLTIKRLVEFKEKIIKKIETFFDPFIETIKMNIGFQKNDFFQKIKGLIQQNQELIQECRSLFERLNNNKIENIKDLLKFVKKYEQENDVEDISKNIDLKILSEITEETMTIKEERAGDFDFFLQKILCFDKKKNTGLHLKKTIPKKEIINKCKVCGGIMKFISNFKKHLTCEGCSKVKRLYG